MILPRARVPHLVFFFGCACIMVIELVASRLIARHLGSSLYTWTAVIGVMLAGISVGNVIGGRLADRRPPEVIVGWLFALAGTACVTALGLNLLFAAARPLRGLGWPGQILLSVVAIFSLPAISLGTLSPALAKIAVERGRRVGATLGSFYAWGTAGSIAGTLLSGFWLLFAFGTSAVVLGTAGVLIVLGLAIQAAGDAAKAPVAALADETGASPASAEVPVQQASRSPSPLPPEVRRPGRGAAGASPGSLSWRYTPHAIAFLASTSLMAVELLASRIIADQAGTSLYTWTSVIGVVLGGMSLGNYVGGVLSDRVEPARFLGWLFLATSASCAGVLVLAYAFSMGSPFHGWHWPAVVFGKVASIFFLPSVLLGTFGPAATKVAVQRVLDVREAEHREAAPGSTAPEAGVGRTLGSVSAWSATGSIAGTLAPGFWLIAAVGSRSLTLLVAALLALAGAWLGPKRWLHLAWAAVVLAGVALTRLDVPLVAGWQHAGLLRPSATDAFDAESAYQHVRVYDSVSEKEQDREIRVLALDYLIHGYVDLDDPGFLNYDYERIYRDVVLRYAEGRTRVSAFFLGGGSYTFPRWVLHRWPGSLSVVAEIDPVVVEANHRALGLRRDSPIRTLVGDARNSVDDLVPDQRFDFFFGDAFNDLSVPYHLTTLEFDRRVASHLEPDGAYLVNVIDSYGSGLFLGAFVNTLRQVFAHVYVFCTDPAGVGERRDTFVVAASNRALDTSGWEPNHGGAFEGSVLTASNLSQLVKKAGGRVLTDDNAPVENLLAPIVRERTPEDR